MTVEDLGFLAEKSLAGEWIGDKGETYTIKRCGKSDWSCTRKDHSCQKKSFVVSYIPSDNRIWWGSAGKFYVDLIEVHQRPHELNWLESRNSGAKYRWRRPADYVGRAVHDEGTNFRGAHIRGVFCVSGRVTAAEDASVGSASTCLAYDAVGDDCASVSVSEARKDVGSDATIELIDGLEQTATSVRASEAVSADGEKSPTKGDSVARASVSWKPTCWRGVCDGDTALDSVEDAEPATLHRCRLAGASSRCRLPLRQRLRRRFRHCAKGFGEVPEYEINAELHELKARRAGSHRVAADILSNDGNCGGGATAAAPRDPALFPCGPIGVCLAPAEPRHFNLASASSQAPAAASCEIPAPASCEIFDFASFETLLAASSETLLAVSDGALAKADPRVQLFEDIARISVQAGNPTERSRTPVAVRPDASAAARPPGLGETSHEATAPCRPSSSTAKLMNSVRANAGALDRSDPRERQPRGVNFGDGHPAVTMTAPPGGVAVIPLSWAVPPSCASSQVKPGRLVGGPEGSLRSAGLLTLPSHLLSMESCGAVDSHIVSSFSASSQKTHRLVTIAWQVTRDLLRAGSNHNHLMLYGSLSMSRAPESDGILTGGRQQDGLQELCRSYVTNLSDVDFAVLALEGETSHTVARFLAGALASGWKTVQVKSVARFAVTQWTLLSPIGVHLDLSRISDKAQYKLFKDRQIAFRRTFFFVRKQMEANFGALGQLAFDAYVYLLKAFSTFVSRSAFTSFQSICLGLFVAQRVVLHSCDQPRYMSALALFERFLCFNSVFFSDAQCTMANGVRPQWHQVWAIDLSDSGMLMCRHHPRASAELYFAAVEHAHRVPVSHWMNVLHSADPKMICSKAKLGLERWFKDAVSTNTWRRISHDFVPAYRA